MTEIIPLLVLLFLFGFCIRIAWASPIGRLFLLIPVYVSSAIGVAIILVGIFAGIAALVQGVMT